MIARGGSTRAAWAAALAAGIFIWLVVTSGTPSAGPGAAPVHVVDAENTSQIARVDAAGSLQVAGQVSLGGTSSVEVTNFPAVQEVSGNVDVANFPDFQKVVTPLAAKFGHAGFDLAHGTFETKGLGVNVGAHLITVANAENDEVEIRFSWQGTTVFSVGGQHANLGYVVLPLTQPVPIDDVTVFCNNDQLDCTLDVYVSGD